MVEFINFCQGGISVKEYSVKFTQLSMYAVTIVANRRESMKKYVMRVSFLVEKECVRQFSFMIWISLGSWCVLTKLRSPRIVR